MKQLALFVLLMTVGIAALAQQLKADAGKDTIWCSYNDMFNAISDFELGGLPPASNGVAPYKYAWTVLENNHSASSGYITDTTVPFPKLRLMTDTTIDSLHFILKVTDAAAMIAYDTVSVTYSRVSCQATPYVLYKKPGDTLQLYPKCFSKYAPANYQWSPGQHLSDPASATPFTWTRVSQDYILTLIDRKGCRVSSSIRVETSPLSVSNVTANEEDFDLFPLPVNNESVLQCGGKWFGSTLLIYSADGKLVSRTLITNHLTHLKSVIPDVRGLYFYRITNAGIVRYGKIER